MGSRRRVSCGQELCHVPELQNIITSRCICGLIFSCFNTFVLISSAESGFDFITIPIVNPRYEREFHPEKLASKRQGPVTRSDLLLASSDWSSLVVGRISPTIDVDSKVPHIRANSEARLAEELRLILLLLMSWN